MELVLDGYVRRTQRLDDALARHAEKWLQANGATLEGGVKVTAEGLLGRPLLPVDPRSRPDDMPADEPMDEEEQAALNEFWADAPDDGLGRGRLTPEELARAQAEARAR